MRVGTALCIVTPVMFVKEMFCVDAAMKVISFLRRMTVKLEYHLAVMFLMSLMSHMCEARAVRSGIIIRRVSVVVCFVSVVVALIAGQHHTAIPDDPCEIGCYEQTKQKEPEFSPPGASGEIRIVPERAL